MENAKPSVLRCQAETLLNSAAYDSKKLVLIHTAVSMAMVVLETVLNYIFDLLVAKNSGLSGLPLRTMLSTAQTALSYFVMVMLPFWEMGLIYTALSWAREKNAVPGNLLEGFRNWGKVLGLHFARILICVAVGLAVFNVVSAVYVMTPFSAPLVEFMEPLAGTFSTPAEMMSSFTPEQITALTALMKPLVIAICVVCALLILPLLYLLRFGSYAVMDGKGAVRSLLYSLRITWKNFGKLVRLDLSLWWFYLLQLLSIAVGSGSVILQLLKINLPFSNTVGYFLFFGLSVLCQGILLWQCQGKVLTSYALLYDAIGDEPEP